MSKSVKIGDIRKGEANGDSYIVFENGITILKDGVEIPLGQYKRGNLFDSMSGAQNLASAGYLDEEKLQKKVEYITKKNITRDVVVYPVTD